MNQTVMHRMSRHATTRCQQRGITQELLRTLLQHHDLDRDVGGNCRVLRMSRRRAQAESRRIGTQITARLERLAVIWSDTTDEVVTVFHDTSRSRRYRETA